MYRYQYTYDDNNPLYRTGHSSNQGPEIEPQNPKRRLAAKITALALCCALIGGGVGAGVSWGVSHGQFGSSPTTVSVSGRPATQVAIKTVDGKSQMSKAEIYATTVNRVVSINCSSATKNVFGQAVQQASSGSGFIITSDGYIVTNHHVVQDAATVKVTLYNGDTYDAKVIGSDADYDIGVLKIETSDLTPVVLGNSDTLNVGDTAMAIGNPLGELTFSMTSGIVSCVNRAINVKGTPFNMIQVDASINPGNSGGPLMNEYGEVVGIVSAKYASNEIEGLGFAIPMNDVAAMIQDIMTNGYITNKAYLGVTAGTMNASMAQQTNLTEGVYLYSVNKGGAAEKAGLQVGDVVTKIDDHDVKSLQDLEAGKKGYSAGDTATFTVLRAEKTITVEVTFDSAPENPQENVQQPQIQQSIPNQDQQMEDLFDYFFNHYGN